MRPFYLHLQIQLGMTVMSRRLCFAVLAFAIAGKMFAAAGAGAAEISFFERKGNSATEKTERILIVSGQILPGTFNRFRQSLVRHKPDLVVLEGPGGLLLEAVLMGTEIRRRGISTVVRANRSCSSACAVAYLAGESRYAGPRAAIGLHAATDRRGNPDPVATSFMHAYLRDLVIPEQMLDSWLVPARQELRWLTKSERRLLRIQPYPDKAWRSKPTS
jgi:hypothetical protein